ncbi:ESPR-type extended signal peptide-containing protein, partial [Veillonella montpellierensis]|uniref:ESPR-type extended signal peptide-containing protein n=1 Tax=Veillonella montpellierensis TaxID=187328 RepID=UPI0023F75495
MNKIYKVIWSRVKHCYVVVSEIAKREGKSTNTTGLARHRAAILAVATLCLVGGAALQTVEAADRYMAVYDPAALEEDMRNNRKQWGNDNDQPKPTNMDYGTFGLMSSWGRIDKRFGLITGVDTFGRQIDDGLKFRTSLGAKFYNLGFGASTFGYGSTADGSKATALGYGSYAKGADALAVGGLAKVTADQGVAIGANTIAGNQATAVGTDSKATGYASIAIGSDDGQPDAMKGGEFADRYPIETINKIFADLRKTKSDAELFDSKYALTLGVVDRRVWSPNYARGQVSIAIGARAVGYGNASTAVGALAFALGEHSTAIGVRSYVSYHAPGGMALGELSRVMAKNGLAVGNLSYSDKQGSVAYGYDAKAVGDNSIAIGHSVGANVELTQDSKNILEKVLTYRVATNPTRVSGTSLETTEDRLTYLDKLKEEWAENQNRQIGEVVGADLKRKVEYAKKQSTVMINGKQEGAANAIAIGRRAYAEGDNSMVMGSLSLGMGTNSLGIGHMTYTSGDNATAIGMEAIATAKNSMAIGVKSYANLENSIAIGVNSRTDYTKEDLEKDGWVPRGAISFPSSTQVGIVSVGSVGQERRIANVAAGYRDTDAVNVSQLRSIEDRFTNNLPNDDVANPFAYTSIEKNKGDAKDVLPLQRKDIDYRKYVHYRTKQLEIMLKERGGERIDNDFKQRIQNEVKKLADNRENAYGIQSTGLAGINDVDALLAELQKIDPKFKDKTNIEQALTVLSTRKKELLKDTLKKSLSPDDLKKLGATNYLNDGAQGKDAIAIGYKALALGDDGIAIGKNSHVPQNVKGGIALGTDALADRDKGKLAYDPKTNTAFASDDKAKEAEGGLRAMKSSGAALSIGNGKVARQIINVAGGTEDTDAVNVAQLKRLGASVDTKVDTKLNDVLNKGLKFHFDPEWGGTPTVGVKQDDSARILIKGKSEGYNSDPRSEFAEGNIGVFGHDFDIDKKKGTKEKGLILTLKKNMTGLESIELSKDGNTVRLGSSGINMGGQKITGMAEGALNANSTDAVTGKQLYAVKTQSENLENTVNTQLGLNITADGGGDPWVGIGTKTNQRGIIAFGVQGGESDTSKLTTKEDKNIGVIVSREKNNDPHQNDDKIITQVRLAKNLTNLESIGLKKNIDGKDYTVQLKGNGIDMGQNKITNMADATLSATSNDAVTGKQLYELQQTVDGKADTGLTNITNGAKDVITGLTNVVGTGAVTVTPTTDNNTRTKTFTVNVAKDGQIVDNNTGLVTGGTVKAALDSVGFNIAGDTGNQPKIAVTPNPSGIQLNIKGNTAKGAELSEGNIGVVAASAQDGNPATLTVKLAKKLADLEEIKLSKDNKTVTLSNTGITMGSQSITGMADGALSADSTDAVTGKQLYGLQENASNINVANWTTALGTGTIGGKNDANLVTGATVKAALDKKVDTTTYTTGMAGKVDTATYNTGMTGKANTALDNITDAGKDVITGLVDVKGAGGATVTSAVDTTGRKKTFTVTVAKDGKIADGDTGIVTGGTVKKALDDKVDTTTYTTGMAGKVDTTTYTTGMTGKANIALDNIDDAGKTVIKNLAGEQINTTVNETYVTGKVKKGNLTSTTLDIQGAGKLVGDNLTINIKDQSITKAKLDSTLSSELDGKMASWVLKASSDANAKDEEAKKGKTIDNTNNDVIFDVATEDASKG